MKILSLDTSTQDYSLAVIKDGKVAARRKLKLKDLLSSSIVPGMKKLLILARVNLNDLDGFAVGLGPGSFTSLRIGVSTIKALSWALQRPVVGISSLDAIALNVPKSLSGKICVLVDARRNMVYAAFYEKEENRLKRTSEYFLIEVDKLLKEVKEDVFFIGDGIKVFKENIVVWAKASGYRVEFAKEKDWFPKAESIAKLALPTFESRSYTPVEQIVPLYLYPEECQVSV